MRHSFRLMLKHSQMKASDPRKFYGKMKLQGGSAMLQRIFLIAISLTALSACQTSMLRSFERVEKGMDKHQVLEKLGNPNATTRMHGKDRWLYRFYDNRVRFDREVHFNDGLVVYVGESWTPPAEKTAEAKDKRNDELNQKVEVDRVEHVRKTQEDFENFQNAARNTDRVRYMPQFKNVD